MQLASLEAERLAADERLLRHRQENLRVRSPLDGVVLAGSLERAESAAVRRGQVIFEIGSVLNPKIEVEIPAADITQVALGQSARVWIEGLEGTAIEGEVAQVQSQAELRNGKLVFVAEVAFAADPTWPLYPGMRGYARIDGPHHPLAWNLFRRPYEWLRSYVDW
jgi:multidrug efflux pump subunit AcrA (membrane-fusion protein)